MMLLLELLVVLVLLGVVGAAAVWIIKYFELPQPVKIIVGCILLLALLFYAVALLNHGGPLIITQINGQPQGIVVR